jgi:transcriptional regulator with XRE-family HTH domain
MALAKVHELGNFIRDQRRNARLSLRKVSQMAGISNPYLSQIERGMRRPSAEILQSIAKALRLSAETLYVKAGILEERGDVDTIAALAHDRSISEKQRRLLVELYQSFRQENEQVPPKAQRPKAQRRKTAAVRKQRTTARSKPKTKKSTSGKKSAPRKRARSTR